MLSKVSDKGMVGPTLGALPSVAARLWPQTPVGTFNL